MRIVHVAKDGNKSCARGCGYIFVLGQTAFTNGYDRLRRPVYVCDKCKAKDASM